MNFVELINDLQVTLMAPHYLDSLWCRINEEQISVAVRADDHDAFRNHMPLDLEEFLKQCISKLQDMKNVSDRDTWEILNEKYICSLIYFILEEEDANMNNALYAANVFLLLNTMCIPEKQLFRKVIYLKILEILNEFINTNNIGDSTIIYLMEDFKSMLSIISLPEETVISTIAILQAFTYFCDEEFQQISTEIFVENLGYIAFVGLKILAEKLAQEESEKSLYPIVLSLMSSLKSTQSDNLQGTAKILHQKNVILFLKGNCHLFQLRNTCLITNALKTVCLSREYDNNQGIAKLVQQLPSEINHDLFYFLVDILLSTRDDFKRSCLDLVVPFLRHPPDYETVSKRLTKAEIILRNVVLLFLDKNEDIKTKALTIVADYSEDTMGRRALRRVLTPQVFNGINKDSVQDILYNCIDPSWNKKKLNINYIQFISNLFIVVKDSVNIKGLNRFRNICLAGSPYDLKSCIVNFKRLLDYYARDQNVTIYVLSIFCKQMFHPMSTSAAFAKELNDIIFSNITVNENECFIWNIINLLISDNFPAYAVFEKFHSMKLLHERHVRILMEYHIQESSTRTPALKLLCIMLNFIQYSKTHLLEEILEEWIITQIPQVENRQRMQTERHGNQSSLSPTDLGMVIYALIKIMERKQKPSCTFSDLQNYRQLQHIVCQAFFEQMFPAVTVQYVITLLSVYARLIEEDVYWDSSACVNFEAELRIKLNDVCNTSLESHIYLLRDVIYVGELLLLKRVSLNSASLALLKRIATASKHTSSFSEYLNNHEEIWSLCLTLYIKASFINPDVIDSCVENLVYILANKPIKEYSKLQILYALYDICSMHLEYYDPLIPFLFHLLNDENDYIRFIATKIIIRLVKEEHLRITDGQYYIFMSLLADNNDIISQNVELFVRNYFVKKFAQTIAGSFLPSVVHYNFCYTYPGISLLEADRELLKSKRNSLTNRRNIYNCLFQHLPSNVKFNILHQLSGEILSKFSTKKLNQIPEAGDLLEDTLAIILLAVPIENIPEITQITKYFDREVKEIFNLLSSAESTEKQTDNKVEKIALRSLCSNLLQILYSDCNRDAKVYQNVLFVISLLRKTFEATIKIIVHENANVKELFSSLKHFYQRRKQHFQDCVLTVVPQSFSSSKDDNSTFYWKELSDFTVIHPYKIIGITNS